MLWRICTCTDSATLPAALAALLEHRGKRLRAFWEIWMVQCLSIKSARSTSQVWFAPTASQQTYSCREREGQRARHGLLNRCTHIYRHSYKPHMHLYMCMQIRCMCIQVCTAWSLVGWSPLVWVTKSMLVFTKAQYDPKQQYTLKLHIQCRLLFDRCHGLIIRTFKGNGNLIKKINK